MKRKYFGVIVCIFSAKSFAWQPCMPFCDANCGGEATIKLGVDVSFELQQLTKSNADLLKSINSSTRSMGSLGIHLSEAWTESTFQLLNQISASANQIDLALMKEIKVHEYATDSTVNNIFHALRSSSTSGMINDNNREFSAVGMPFTGEVLVEMAGPYREAYGKSKHFNQEVLINQEKYGDKLSSGSTSFEKRNQLSLSNQALNATTYANKKTLSDAELKKMQLMITYITNQKPLPKMSKIQKLNQGAVNYELSRRLYNAKSAFAKNALNEIISHRAEYMSSDWVKGYVLKQSNTEGLSAYESMDGLINGRLASSEWYLDMKSKSETGLDRELTYLKAEENVLLFTLYKRKEIRNQLLALLVAEKTQQQAKNIKE